MTAVAHDASTLTLLRDACRTLLSRYNGFWLLAALTDRSYEEGTRAPSYGRFVQSYSEVGIPAVLLDELRKGINGNLNTELRQRFSDVRRHRSHGQDFEIDSASDNPVAIEIKMIWDHTFPKYFLDVAKDGKKLEELRERGFGGSCYQVVFFVQLPNYRYPSGSWPDGKHYKERRCYTKKLGVESCIKSQWDYLKQHLPAKPRWPTDDQPFVKYLEFPTEIVTDDLLVRWFDSCFQPDAKNV